MRTKDKILQETFGLLLRRGYYGVSVTDIQEQARIARGLLYHYFDSQEQLLGAAVEKFMSDWFDWNREERKEDSLMELAAFVVGKYRQIGQVISENFGLQVALADVRILLQEAARYQNSVAEQYGKMRDEHYAIWKTALLNSFSRGELRPGINLESVTRYFVYIQDGVVLNDRSDMSCSDVVYRMDRSFRDFFEIIRR